MKPADDTASASAGGAALSCGLSPQALGACLLYSLASASMLILNKLAMQRFPLPSLLSLLQFSATTITVIAIDLSGAAQVDAFEWAKVKPYLYYVVMFVATIYCNMKSLEHSNVETIIVFRACCPLCVCLLDWGFPVSYTHLTLPTILLV